VGWLCALPAWGARLKKEWWYHGPSGTWFIAERNTLTDKVSRTYLYGQENKA